MPAKAKRIDAQTEPCPRCRSFKTRALGYGKEIFLRHCLDCHFRWDYVEEFAPRRRVKRA